VEVIPGIQASSIRAIAIYRSRRYSVVVAVDVLLILSNNQGCFLSERHQGHTVV